MLTSLLGFTPNRTAEIPDVPVIAVRKVDRQHIVISRTYVTRSKREEQAITFDKWAVRRYPYLAAHGNHYILKVIAADGDTIALAYNRLFDGAAVGECEVFTMNVNTFALQSWETFSNGIAQAALSLKHHTLAIPTFGYIDDSQFTSKVHFIDLKTGARKPVSLPFAEDEIHSGGSRGFDYQSALGPNGVYYMLAETSGRLARYQTGQWAFFRKPPTWSLTRYYNGRVQAERGDLILGKVGKGASQRIRGVLPRQTSRISSSQVSLNGSLVSLMLVTGKAYALYAIDTRTGTRMISKVSISGLLPADWEPFAGIAFFEREKAEYENGRAFTFILPPNKQAAKYPSQLKKGETIVYAPQ